MFSEILKIIPKLEEKDLKAMQNALQSRFKKLAQGFGKGLVNVLKGGGIAGIALGLIDKVLNPIKEVQEAIDRTLQSSDDLATNANQFNTTTGKLFKLVQLAKSTGLDQDNLFQLINKFQTAVAQAKANPTDQSVSSVRNFVGQDDTAEAFFGFITQLQQLSKDQQVLVQQQIFGEKQILRMADFLQTDFQKQATAIGIDKVTADQLSRDINKMGDLNDLADSLKALREVQDVRQKSAVINEGIIRARDKSERVALERENQKIQSYQDLATISATVDNIMKLVDQGIGMLGGLIKTLTPFVNDLIPKINQLLKSPLVRGIGSIFGKDK